MNKKGLITAKTARNLHRIKTFFSHELSDYLSQYRKSGSMFSSSVLFAASSYCS